MDRPKFEVADIFRRYGEAYREQHDASLSSAQRRVMTAIEVCRTAALGGHLERCDCCNHERPCYDTCRDRHCPKCQSLARAQWVEKRTIRSSPDALFSCRLHHSRTDRCHRLPEQRSRLRHSVPSHCRDLVHHRCRSQTSGRRDRLFRCTSQLGTEPAFSSSSPLCRSRRRDFTGWYPVDLLPPQLFLARTGALPVVPPIVPEVSAGGLRRRQVALLLFASDTSRSSRLSPVISIRCETWNGSSTPSHPSPGHSKWWTMSAAIPTASPFPIIGSSTSKMAK